MVPDPRVPSSLDEKTKRVIYGYHCDVCFVGDNYVTIHMYSWGFKGDFISLLEGEMSWTLHRKARNYFDLVKQVWSTKDVNCALGDMRTMGFADSATATLNYLNPATWLVGNVTAMETWFTLASINMNYISMNPAAKASNSTLSYYSGQTMVSGGETVKR